MWPFSARYPDIPPAKANNLRVDYIIVGAGTAGCVLASRLSENPNVKVLLLERGPVSDDWVSKVPLLSSGVYRPNAPVLWRDSLPLTNATGQTLRLVTADILGGASRLNGAVYTRGVGDYNKWEEMGCSGWGYEDLEPYFKKSEHHLSASAATDTHRGNSGPWMNQKFPLAYDVLQHVETAVTSLGIPVAQDVNSPDSPATCYTVLDLTVDQNGHRSSTFHSFLPKSLVMNRKNLTVCTNTLVMRVSFNKKSGRPRAVGVYFQERDTPGEAKAYFASAEREIIICAGAIGSPQLLMLSGVGPASHLKSMSVTPVKDLPVGSVLRDHIMFPLQFQIPMDHSMHVFMNKPWKALCELMRYVTTGNSVFRIPFLQPSIFVRSSLLAKDMTFSTADLPSTALDARLPEALPDFEVMPVPVRCSNMAKDPELDPLGVFTFLTCLLQPKSYGSVRLANPDPLCPPDIDLGFFSNADDWITARTAIRFALRLADTMRQQGYPIKELDGWVPKSKSDGDIDEYVRKRLLSTYHFTSTCRMGREHDPTHPGVVDEQLRVHGIDSLRICDTSVFPDVLSTHTMAGAVVVAEKCADMISKGS